MTAVMLKGGGGTTDPRLDRVPSRTTEHFEKYPLRAMDLRMLAGRPVPVVVGVNWYSAFDNPEKDSRGRWWVGRGANLGAIRGGHAVCWLPLGFTDPLSWWEFYNQGQEGRCVQFATMRCASLLDRVRYDINDRTLYWDAQREDEWPGGSYPGASPVYEGTSVRAGLEIYRRNGIKRAPRSYPRKGVVEGISEYRWAMSEEDAAVAAGRDDYDAIPFLNSWGRRGYPHIVWMPRSVWDRLYREQGEFGLVVPR